MSLGDQPVHPTPWVDGKPVTVNGITLRQWYAGLAMIRHSYLMVGGEKDPSRPGYFECVAKCAFEQADAMLAELEKPKS